MNFNLSATGKSVIQVCLSKGVGRGKKKAMSDRGSQVLRCLLDAPVVTVEPGFTVEMRTSYGVHGENDDLALSVEWRDAEGCLWAADFTEDALARAELRKGTISLRDVEGGMVVFQLYQPAVHVAVSLNQRT
jgi:hypothetical protein